ncbi:glycerol-3-phosphate dehydrogenase [Acrasis kona]|uniref:Glycerol-3-phosphate dehydrogenase n=1 Tax=Acrasis kona TaxID=1008807 RepID=A0AAW2YSP9_9EUKA
MLVIGGGATGTGVALDATSRGLKVCLVEMNDFASGTSSRATKMAHGGVRYLARAVENLDIGELEFVQDSLRERRHFFLVAPHLSTPLPLITPCFNYFEVAKNFAGLTLYDLLSGTAARIGFAQYVSVSETLKISPGLKPEGLRGSIRYFDGIFNDARLCMSVALTASALGACTLNHMRVDELLLDDASLINGAKVTDQLTGEKYTIKSKSIVNATGYFSDTIRRLDDSAGTDKLEPRPEIMKPSAGVHIALDNKLFTPDSRTGVLFSKTKDGRVMYLVPYEGVTIAGTTDIPLKGEVTNSTLAVPDEEQIDFILDMIKEFYKVDVKRSDVKSSWAGFRPLVVAAPTVDSGNGQSSTAVMSRDHFIEVSKRQMVSITGGKWTTFRRMAEETVDMVYKVKNLPFKRSQTSKLVLVGAQKYDQVKINCEDQKVVDHLKHYYGDRAEKVTQIADQLGLWNKLALDMPYIEAEVIYQVRSEMACKASDVLAYRTSLMFLDREKALNAVPRVVELMAKELKWSEAQKQEELQKGIQYISTCTI